MTSGDNYWWQFNSNSWALIVLMLLMQFNGQCVVWARDASDKVRMLGRVTASPRGLHPDPSEGTKNGAYRNPIENPEKHGQTCMFEFRCVFLLRNGQVVENIMFKSSVLLCCFNLNSKLFDLLMGEPKTFHFYDFGTFERAITKKQLFYL